MEAGTVDCSPRAPNRGPRASHRRSLRRYVDLVLYRTFADLKSEASRTYLGFAWWILEPLLYLGILYFVFGYLRGAEREGFVPFLVVGLVFWQWFRASVSHACDAIRISLFLLRQVRLPPALLPLIANCTDAVKFALVLLVMLVALTMLGHPPTWSLLYLPLVIVAGTLLIVGCGLLAAAFTPIVPDMKLLVDTLLMGLMFISGIFFSVEQVPVEYRWVMTWNPAAMLLESARSVLLDAQPPGASRLAYVALFGASAGLVGLGAIRALGHRYTKMAH